MAGLKGSKRTNWSCQLPKRLVFAMTLVFVSPAALLAQVTVLMSGGFSAAYQELLPQFGKSTGITVTTLRGASQGDGKRPDALRQIFLVALPIC
jgi:hypothetical protein